MTIQDIWNNLPWCKKRLLIYLDILVNWRTGGVFGETVSERLARARNLGKREGIIGCHILDAIDPGHCDRALRR